MKTTCELCLFSIKKDGKQIGCEFNRLDNFKKEYVDDTYYLIDGLCRSCRNVNWYFYCDHPESSKTELIEQCKKEISLDYNFFILYKNGVKEELIESIKFLDKSKIKPKYIYILTTLDLEEAKKLYIDVIPHTNINVKIDIVSDKNISDDKLIRRGFDICNSNEYTVIANTSFNKEFDRISLINQIEVLDKGTKFYFAEIYDYYIVDTSVAKEILFCDESDKSLRDKLLAIFSSEKKRRIICQSVTHEKFVSLSY